LSTSEVIIREIQERFANLRKIVDQKRVEFHQRGMSVEEAKNLFRQTVSFQRLLESKEQQVQVFRNAAYFERTSKRFATVLGLLTSTTELKKIKYYVNREIDSYSVYMRGDEEKYDVIEGIVLESRQLVERCKKDWHDLEDRSLSGISEVLDDMELDLEELYADLRLVTELMAFPAEQRMKLKDELLRNEFREVVEYLEGAEQNLVLSPPHLKDSLSNSRLAVESILYELLRREQIAPVRKFSIDLAELCKKSPDIIDDATRHLVQGVYSYLSMKGSHVFSSVERKDLAEAEFGLDQTYTILSHILARLKPTPKKSPRS
jgi:hypothetical protein